MQLNLVTIKMITIIIVINVCNLEASFRYAESDISTYRENYPDTECEIECVPIRECGVLKKLIQATSWSHRKRKFILSLRCDHFKGGSKVWCIRDKEQPCQQMNRTPRRVSLPNASKNECGLERISKDDPNDEDQRVFIAFGKNAGLGQYPWMALLEYRNRHNALVPRCGASLINSRYVLTAAHCLTVNQRQFKLESVLLGEHDLNEKTDCVIGGCKIDCCFEAKRYIVESFITHPMYLDSAKEGLHKHDVGLVRLEKEVEFSEYIKPVCLPRPTFKIGPEYAQFKVAGWGLTENGSVSSILQTLEVPAFESIKCSDLLGYEVSNTQLCAGGQDKKDTCNGDSGGPLMYAKSLFDRQVIQIGIVSLSIGRTCGSGRPNIYTDIRKYMDWINENLKP